MDYIQRARQFKTKKRLGQNFLVDSNIIQKIIDEADLSGDETVIEIGPGIGFVTEQLAEHVKKVIAIELDEQAIFQLQKLPYSNIEIINKDILQVNIGDLVDQPVKIIANIPYYITSPILVHLLGEIDQQDYENRKSVKEIIIMVQYEVAKRMIANEKSPSKDYGLLSILVNFWSVSELICKVPAKSFYPIPAVDSALIKLTIRENPIIELENPKLFRRVIQACFGKRRKNIKNALTMGGFTAESVQNALAKAGIDPVRRGETLSLEEFKAVTDVISDYLKP